MFLLEVKYWRLGNVLRLIAQKRSGWSLTVGGGGGNLSSLGIPSRKEAEAIGP